MREVRWASEEGEGIEHLAFDARAEGFFVESAVVGQRYGKGYGLYYRVHCDPQLARQLRIPQNGWRRRSGTARRR